MPILYVGSWTSPIDLRRKSDRNIASIYFNTNVNTTVTAVFVYKGTPYLAKEIREWPFRAWKSYPIVLDDSDVIRLSKMFGKPGWYDVRLCFRLPAGFRNLGCFNMGYVKSLNACCVPYNIRLYIPPLPSKHTEPKTKKVHVAFNVYEVKQVAHSSNAGALKIGAYSSYPWPLMMLSGNTVCCIGTVKGKMEKTWWAQKGKACVFPKHPDEHIIPPQAGACKYYQYVKNYYTPSWMNRYSWSFYATVKE